MSLAQAAVIVLVNVVLGSLLVLIKVLPPSCWERSSIDLKGELQEFAGIVRRLWE